MADSLETEVGRFEYYKKKLEEEKATVPQLTAASPKAVELAMHEANGDIFPPMGLINFNKVPDGVDKEKYIGFKVDDILRGTVQYIHYLQSQPPAYLQGWGISRLPIYRESDAAKNLVAKTKVSYSKLSEEMSNIEDGEAPEFSDPALNKLSSKDIQNLLDSSILEFLKEIGVDRSGGGVKQNDDLILESSQKIYEFLTKAGTPVKPSAPIEPIVTKTEEAPMKVKEAEKMEPVPTSPAAPPAQAAPVPPQTPTVVEKSQPPIEPEQPSVPAQNTTTTEPANIATAEPANIATPETTNQPVAPLSDVPFTETESVSVSGSGSASVSTPLLDLLGTSSGMSSDDIAKMFQGEGGMEKLQQGLDLSFPGSPIKTETIAAAIGQAQPATTVQQQNATANAPVATKTAEPAKIAETIQAPPAPPQTPAAPVAPPEAPKEAPTPPAPTEDKGKAEENAAAAETKQAEETKSKEQDQTNAELLKVMKDILKALHGPLIVTDGKHNFS